MTFWDTAEMYPTNPVRAETVGRTEEIIGTWLAARGGRDRLVLATKITGKGQIARPGEPITGATHAGGGRRQLAPDADRLHRPLSAALAEPGQLSLSSGLALCARRASTGRPRPRIWKMC